MMPRRALPLLVAGALALAVAGGALARCDSDPVPKGCTTGADTWVRCAAGQRPAAPALAGDTLDGGRYELARQRGQVVVVNFWASWCAPCRAEADDLAAVHARYRDQGVGFVGVNVRDAPDAAKAFEAGRHEYPSIFDQEGRVALQFRDLLPITGPPVTVVVDRAGNIAALVRQAITAGELAAVVGEVVTEQPPGGAR